MALNERIEGISPSKTLAVTSRAKALKAAGNDVCSFAAGEPDFGTPEHVSAAAVKALADGLTRYAPVAGVPVLRAAVAQKLTEENGLPYSAEDIVVSFGGKHALFNIMLALCRPGDEVIIPAPYWLSYPEMVRVAGGTPVSVRTSAESGYIMSADQLRAAVTDRSRAVVLNSPSNPTGAVYTRKQLEALAEVIVEKDLYVIADEMYEKILYDGAEHVSIGSLSDEVFMANRFAATAFAVFTAAGLAFATGATGKGAMTLWPMFGAGNQLLAALALLVITNYLAEKGGHKYLVTAIP